MPGAYRGLGSGPGDANSTAGELFVVPAVCVSSTFSTTTTKKKHNVKRFSSSSCAGRSVKASAG